MATKTISPKNPALFMEFPDGAGESMEEMFGITKDRAIYLADAIRDDIEEIIPGWNGSDDFVRNMPIYTHLASMVCETPKELSFFMMKLGGFVEQHGMIKQDPEELVAANNRIRNRKRPDVN